MAHKTQHLALDYIKAKDIFPAKNYGCLCKNVFGKVVGGGICS